MADGKVEIGLEGCVYKFPFDGCILTIDEKMVKTVDISLNQQDIESIKEYFSKRGMRWKPDIDEGFKEHDLSLYVRIQNSLQDLYEQSEEYEVEQYELEVMSEQDCEDYEPVILEAYWPHKIFKEMGINMPNISIWVSRESSGGMGYPIYLEDDYVSEVRNIIDSYNWGKIGNHLNVDDIRSTHRKMVEVIEERIKDMLLNTFNYEESQLKDLKFSIWEYTIPPKEWLSIEGE